MVLPPSNGRVSITADLRQTTNPGCERVSRAHSCANWQDRLPGFARGFPPCTGGICLGAQFSGGGRRFRETLPSLP
jgi:hypothetical protein